MNHESPKYATPHGWKICKAEVLARVAEEARNRRHPDDVTVRLGGDAATLLRDRQRHGWLAPWVLGWSCHALWKDRQYGDLAEINFRYNDEPTNLYFDTRAACYGPIYECIAGIALDTREERPAHLLAHFVTAEKDRASDVEIEMMNYDEWRTGLARSPFAYLGVTLKQIEVLVGLGARVLG